MHSKLAFDDDDAFTSELDARIEACFVFKRRVNQAAANNTFVHWAVVLQGRDFYHLLELGFSPHGIAYSFHRTLKECASSMMGNDFVVHVCKVKRNKDNLAGTNSNKLIYDFRAFEWTFREVKYLILPDWLFDVNQNSNFLAINSESFCEYLISKLRLGWDYANDTTSKKSGLEECLTNPLVCDFKIYLEDQASLLDLSSNDKCLTLRINNK